MAVWIAFFFIMTAIGKTDGRHTGDKLPFWVEACSAERPNACRRLIQLETTYCDDNSGWACNEIGLHYVEGKLVTADAERAQTFFGKACETRFQAACLNALDPAREARAEPRPLDLRLLLREGGLNLTDMPEPNLYERACEHGWTFACAKTARAKA
jgi:TPR repeat protein